MFQPTQDFLMVKPLIRKQSSIIEVLSQEKQCRGEVIAAGPGKASKRGVIIPLDVKAGQVVAFGDGNFDFYPKHYVSNPDGTSDEYRIIQEADVTFVIEYESDAVAA